MLVTTGGGGGKLADTPGKRTTVQQQQARIKQGSPAPTHPSKSSSKDAACKHAQEEVYQLPAEVPKAKANMQGIVAMLQSKAQRHADAWASYQVSRQLAEQQHTAAAAAAAAGSRSQLQAVTNSIEAIMSVLAEDKVMVLDEQQLKQVWQSVEEQQGPVTQCIEALAAGLRSAEAALVQQVQAALQEMVAAMHDIAHLDEGRVQRLTEQEAVALNLQVLANREATAEVLQQLHASEVLLHQARYQRWQAACEAWRTLRSKHAAACFRQHVEQDLAQPPERLQLFAQVQDSQGVVHAQLLKLCQRIPQLAPPHLNAEAAASWAAAAKQWSNHAQQEVERHMQELRQQEQELQQQVLKDLAALRVEVLGYKGLSDSEVDELLQQEVQPALQSRQEAASALLQRAEDYLRRQLAEWQLAVQVLSSWLGSVAGLVDSHKAATAAGEARIKATLRAAVQQFQCDDAARETTLSEAIQLLSQGSDEKELDVRLQAALDALTAIQSGYRAHAASAISTIRTYPGEVRERNSLYIKCLCGLLHMQPQQQAAAADPAPDAGEQAASQAQCDPEWLEPIQLPTGAVYKPLHGLWQALLDATDKPWLQQFKHLQHQSAEQQPGQSDAPQVQQQAAAAAAEASSAAAPAPKAPPAGKLTKQQQAEAAAAEEAARAAETAAAAAAAEAAAYAAALAQPPCPASIAGEPLCLDLRTPDATICEGLKALQASLLQEAESHASRVQGGAESWSEEMEALVTEELDGRLRAHRPRAGRIEEEVRVARSAELLEQRRRVDSHLKAQEKAVQQQAAQVDAAVQDLRAAAAAWQAKLLGYERLLGNCMGSKGIDICWREAQALRVKQDKQLEQRMQQLEQLVQDTCSALVSTSKAFEQEHLKSFADGGRYADASLSAHRNSMATLYSYMSQQQAQQQAQLAALKTELAQGLREAQDTIEALLPSHKQDMALVELLAQKVEGARRKAAAELSKNKQAADSIDAVISELQDRVNRAQAAASSMGPAVDSSSDKAQLHQLVDCVNSLRQQLLRQGQVLELLQSTGIPDQQVVCIIPGELQAGPAAQHGAPPEQQTTRPLTSRATTPRQGKPGAPAHGPKATGKAAGGRAGSAGTKGQVGAAASASAAAAAAAAAALAAAGGVGGPVAAEQLAVPLAKHISAITDSSKQEVKAAAQAYFSAKEAGRPIRYPAKIAPTLQELMASVDGVMSGLQQMLQEHVESVAKRLRVQVVQAYRLLEKVPAAALSLLLQLLLAQTTAQRQQLLSNFAQQRRQLEQQLEQHKHSLHPSMLNVARRAELEALKASEASRQQAAAALTTSCAAACLSLTQSHAQQLTAAAVELSRLLLLLLDGCVLPADLVPAPEGDDSLADLQRLSLEELSRLAAAQDAAPPAGPAFAASSKTAAGKPTKPGDTAAAAPGTTSTGSASGRPFSYVSWQLEECGSALSALGWSAADQAALEAACPATVPAAAPAAAAVPATGQAKPSGVGAPKATAAAAAQAPGSTQSAAQQATAAAETLTVCGLDTVCHRAVVLAHRAAVQLAQAHLKQAAVSPLRLQLRGWAVSEQQWAQAWEAMLQDLDTV